MLSRTLSRFVSKASTKPAISVAITKQVAEMATAPQEPTVSDLLQRKSQRTSGSAGVLTVQSDASIQSAARLMLTNKIGSLVVVDKSSDFMGIITERDLLRVADGTVDRQSRVGEIMTAKAKILHCKVSDTVLQVMSLINSNNIRHVPVLTPDQKGVAAMISIKDCVDHAIFEHERELETMKGFVSGTY